jgi:hypothetical protein
LWVLVELAEYRARPTMASATTVQPEEIVHSLFLQQSVVALVPEEQMHQSLRLRAEEDTSTGLLVT